MGVLTFLSKVLMVASPLPGPGDPQTAIIMAAENAPFCLRKRDTILFVLLVRITYCSCQRGGTPKCKNNSIWNSRCGQLLCSHSIHHMDTKGLMDMLSKRVQHVVVVSVIPIQSVDHVSEIQLRHQRRYTQQHSAKNHTWWTA